MLLLSVAVRRAARPILGFFNQTGHDSAASQAGLPPSNIGNLSQMIRIFEEYRNERERNRPFLKDWDNVPLRCKAKIWLGWWRHAFYNVFLLGPTNLREGHPDKGYRTYYIASPD